MSNAQPGVAVQPDGSKRKVTLTCTKCHISRLTQVHDRHKPLSTVESILKTTARSIGWKITAETVTCPGCRRV